MERDRGSLGQTEMSPSCRINEWSCAGLMNLQGQIEAALLSVTETFK